MIQRIQTVYLALVMVLSFACLVSPIGEYNVGNEVVASFTNFTFDVTNPMFNYESVGPYALGILLIVVLLLSLLSIMLFRKRMRQLRLTIISSILLVGYIIVYAMFAYFYGENLNLANLVEEAKPVFHLKFIATFPVICLFLNILAIMGIRRDEALVRSLDRLRP